MGNNRTVSGFRSREYIVAIPPLSLVFMLAVVLVGVAIWLYRVRKQAERRRAAAEVELKQGDW